MNHDAVLVDEQDNVIGQKGRLDLEKGDIIRIALLWIENSQGQILLAQRSFSKENDPGLWGPAVAGTIEAGETYETNIYKEAEEEIGLTGVNLAEFTKDFFWMQNGVGRFATWFKAEVDWPLDKFTLQKTEVEGLAWFDKQQLRNELADIPAKFAPGAVHWHDLGFI